jgi:hypothetical protein
MTVQQYLSDLFKNKTQRIQHAEYGRAEIIIVTSYAEDPGFKFWLEYPKSQSYTQDGIPFCIF